MPTRRVGRSGCAVRIGRPRYACIESADSTSPPRLSATASATAVLPEAVGPKIARTLGADWRARLPANVGVLWEESVRRQRSVFFGMRRAVLLEPRHGTCDALLERNRGLVSEQLARLRQIGDVVRDLAEKRWSERDLRLDAELACDQLGRMDERVAVAVGEVDRLVHHATIGERLDPARDAID